MPLSRTRTLLWAAAGIAGAGYLGLIAWMDNNIHGHFGGAADDASTDAIVPRFGLTDHTGAAVTEATYRGRWLLVLFGFTNCPDVSPTTLARVAEVVEGLGPAAAPIQALFISVDPSRDDPAVLEEYVAAFHPSIVGLTGSEEELASAAATFGADFARIDQPGAPGGYTMSHTSALYLVAPDGHIEQIYTYGTPATDILADLKHLLE